MGKIPGAVDVWVRNWQHAAQLYNYGSAVRKVMYTTYTDKKTIPTFFGKPAVTAIS